MKLILADDHTLFRDALVQYIQRAEPDAEVALAKDFYQVIEILGEDADHDLLLLDLRMPGMKGLDGLKKIRDVYPDLRVALMSGVAEPEDVKNALDLGACGYFPKTLSGKALIKAIQLVLEGEKFVPIETEGTNIMPSYYGDGGGISKAGNVNIYGAAKNGHSDDFSLTPRENEVLSHLALGKSNKEIANELELQEVTVKLHVRGICRKLDVKNRTQAALKAQELGLTG